VRRSHLSLLLAISTLPLPASAATLEGHVRSADGRGLPLVPVEVKGATATRHVVTGADGSFRVEELEDGSYEVSLDVPGLEPDLQTVALAAGSRVELTARPEGTSDEVVVTAERAQTPLANVGVSVTSLDAARIGARQATTLLDVLQEVPGVQVARTGGVGRQGSMFLRGGDSNYTRVLVDGFPVNEAGGQFDLGAAVPLEIGSLEIVRGAASALYGTDALAGVVNLITRRGAGGPQVRASAEGGSNAWWRGEAGLAGAARGVDWNGGLTHTSTDGEVENADFSQTGAAASLGYAPSPSTTLRLVGRFSDAEAGTPGQTVFGQSDLDATLERATMLVGLTATHETGPVVHVLRAGVADSDELSRNPLDSGAWTPRYGTAVAAFPFSDFTSVEGYQNDTTRWSFGYQAEVAPLRRHVLTAGIDVEHETGELGSRDGGDLLSPSRTNFGVFAQDRILVGSRAFLTLGARVEENDSFGTEVVPRASLAVRLREGDHTSTLKGSGGMGIKEPSFDESFGTSPFALGNPALDAERSTTFDLGLEQRLGRRVRAEATWFHHRYEDQIAYHVTSFEPFAGTFVNVGESRARGLELMVDAEPVPALRIAASYTFLDSEVVTSGADGDPLYAAGEPLLRRPRHQGSLWVEGRAGRFSGGGSLTLVGSRADSDFAGLGLTLNEAYERLDLRLRMDVVSRLQVFVAADNVLDEEYQEALGYAAPGATVRVGLRWLPEARP
jgi:vitamin B12 transporter